MTPQRFAGLTFEEGIEQFVMGFDNYMKIPGSEIIIETGPRERLPLPKELRSVFEESVVYSVIQRLKLHECDECHPLSLWLAGASVEPKGALDLKKLEVLWITTVSYGGLNGRSGPQFVEAFELEGDRFERWIEDLEKALIHLLHNPLKSVTPVLGDRAGARLWERFIGGARDHA